MTIDNDRIKWIARNATPGPWRWTNPQTDAPRAPGEYRSSLRTVAEFPTSVGLLPKFIVEADEIRDDNMEANATFMETISPDVVLKLVKRLERAHAALREARPSLAMWKMDTSAIDVLLADEASAAAPAHIPTQEYSYAYTADSERWHGRFNSVAEAIADALGEYVPDQDRVVYVGENEPIEINCEYLASEVIDQIQEQAYDQVGEVADSIGPFSEKEIQPLATAIQEWIDEHADFSCWKVEKSKAYRPGDAEYEQARAMLPLVKEARNV